MIFQRDVPILWGRGASRQSLFGKCSVAAGLFLMLVCPKAHLSLVCASPIPPPRVHLLSLHSHPLSLELLASGILWDFTGVQRKKDPGEICRGQKTLLTGSHTSFSISELECRCERAAIIGVVWKMKSDLL